MDDDELKMAFFSGTGAETKDAARFFFVFVARSAEPPRFEVYVCQHFAHGGRLPTNC